MAKKIRGGQAAIQEAKQPKQVGGTLEEWEKRTGNKALSYSTIGGKLLGSPTKYQSMSDWNKSIEEGKKNAESAKQQEELLRYKGENIDYTPSYGTSDFMQKTPTYNQASYSRMFGNPDQFSSLEAASMRLADAAAARERQTSALQSDLEAKRMGYGSALKMNEMKLGSGLEYGTKSKLLGQESALESARMAQEYGLKSNLLGRESELSSARTAQEYGLKSNLLGRQADIEAQQQGYSGLSAMQADIARRRLEEENKARNPYQYR